MNLAQKLASLFLARQNCIKSQNTEWKEKHEETIATLCKTLLPSGSGFDIGCTLDLEASTPDRLVITCDFHHMYSHGMYAGWAEHKAIVTASLSLGVVLEIQQDDDALERMNPTSADYAEAIADYAEEDISYIDGYSWAEYASEVIGYALDAEVVNNP